MMMAVALSVPGREVACNKCGKPLFAPEFSENFGEEKIVIRFWSCLNCGNQFETEAGMPVNPKPNIDGKALT